MNLPKISVITVARNDVAHIEQTMLSVLGQTYGNVEYIVIDGGSTDGTVDIIKKYADKLAYWVSEPDGGIYPAMNKGLQHATGEWVNFMNSGDSFADDNVLEEVFGGKYSLESKYVIGGHTHKIFADHIEEMYALDGPAIYCELPFCHQSTFVRFRLENPWRFNNYSFRIAADYALLYEIAEKYGTDSFFVVDRFISNYRMEESMTFANLRKAKKEYLKIQSAHINFRWIKEVIKLIFK